MARTHTLNPVRWRTRLARVWFLLVRFAWRYGPALLALVASAVIGWAFATSVSDYTHGGWEIHIIQASLGINIHFHHWYYGIPLYLLAFATVEWKSLVSIFLFGLGETLAAHSFINEHGIPSIIQGGPTLPVPPELYFSVVTALGLLYAVFLIRREEWLYHAQEREEIAKSYLCPRAQMTEICELFESWAARHLQEKRVKRVEDSQSEYGLWYALDRERDGEWELNYVISPFDEQSDLFVIRLSHVPVQGRKGLIDDWMRELDSALKPLAMDAVEGAPAGDRPLELKSYA